MTGKKYLCIGGFAGQVVTRNRHYISARRLPGLYRVGEEECEFMLEEADLVITDRIILRPDPTGRYQVPASKETTS